MDDIAVLMKQNIPVMTVLHLKKIADKRVSCEAFEEVHKGLSYFVIIITVKEFLQSLILQILFEAVNSRSVLNHLNNPVTGAERENLVGC